MTAAPPPSDLSDAELAERVTDLLAHLWMVRTFVKHSEEAEEFPELLELPRVAFDAARALESRLDDRPALLRMTAKKAPKLRRAAAAFRIAAAEASTHTNWQQAAVSLDAVVAGLTALLPPPPAPPRSPMPPRSPSPRSPSPRSTAPPP